MTETMPSDALTIRPLAADTWPAFEDLAERHSGAGMGGCWCTAFHNATRAEKLACTGGNYDQAREYKKGLVETGRAHAALVLDGEVAIGWCEYGTPEELPGIHHLKEYLATVDQLPDYRITCFFVDRRSRRKGVATVALHGALDLIADAGGGVVESYPQDTGGKRVSASFLFNATRSLFEQAGFIYDRPKGKNHCVMRRSVAPAI